MERLQEMTVAAHGHLGYSSQGLRYSWGRVLTGGQGLEVPPWRLKAEQEEQFALSGEP